MLNYKLLTPGPLTTTESVKKEMLFDHCTWDDDYKQITQDIRKELLSLAHVTEDEYTVVLMTLPESVTGNYTPRINRINSVQEPYSSGSGTELILFTVSVTAAHNKVDFVAVFLIP